MEVEIVAPERLGDEPLDLLGREDAPDRLAGDGQGLDRPPLIPHPAAERTDRSEIVIAGPHLKLADDDPAANHVGLPPDALILLSPGSSTSQTASFPSELPLPWSWRRFRLVGKTSGPGRT